MRFWEKVKSAAVSAKCKLGIHAGDYSPAENKPKCNLEKICPDCKENLTKVRHEYGKWQYIQEGKCDSTRSCIHCGEEENKVRHSFSEYKEKCKVYDLCTRCNSKSFKREEHNMLNGPVTIRNGERVQISGCSRCNKKEYRTIASGSDIR